MTPVAASISGSLLNALSFAFGMFWEILWALILGFALSAAVQAVVSKREMRKLLPDGLAAFAFNRRGSRCGFLILLLCRSGTGAITFP